jgi:hypothetical protein
MWSNGGLFPAIFHKMLQQKPCEDCEERKITICEKVERRIEPVESLRNLSLTHLYPLKRANKYKF